MNDYRTKLNPPTQSTKDLPVGLHTKTPPWGCLRYFMENKI